MRHKRQSGTTLVELIVVVAVSLVLMAVMTPYLAAAVASFRVRSAADELAGLLQQARLAAVRDNKFYSVIDNNALAVNVRGGCVDMNWNGLCTSDEPTIEMAGEVQIATAGAPNTTVITCGAAVPCPAGYTGLSFTPQAMDIRPSFTARGLPCVNNPANVEPIWNLGGQCNVIDAGGNPVGFLITLRYTGALGTSYSAVAVTPAGRVTVWSYSGNVGGVDKWVR